MSYRSHSGGKTPRSNTLPLICEAASFSLAHRGLDLVTPSVSPSLEVPHIDIPSTKITPNALASLSSSSSSATQDHAVKSRECHHSSLHRQCVECVKKELVKTRASSVLNCLKDIYSRGESSQLCGHASSRMKCISCCIKETCEDGSSTSTTTTGLPLPQESPDNAGAVPRNTHFFKRSLSNETLAANFFQVRKNNTAGSTPVSERKRSRVVASIDMKDLPEGICEHLKLQDYCKACKGSEICAHNNVGRYCKQCAALARSSALSLQGRMSCSTTSQGKQKKKEMDGNRAVTSIDMLITAAEDDIICTSSLIELSRRS